MAVLLLAEHDGQMLNAATGKALAAAKEMRSKAEIHILIVGEASPTVIDRASRLCGCSKVIVASGAHLRSRLAEEVSSLIISLMDNYDVVVSPATATGKSVFPRVAAKLDVMQISEISKVISPDTFERFVYAGNAVQLVTSCDKKKVITVRASAFCDVETVDSAAPVEHFEGPEAIGLSTLEHSQLTSSDRPELTSAKIVVAGGRGLRSSENFSTLIGTLADRLGAAIGASRAAVDAGYVSNDMQIGQTGKVVAPDLYIAVGISGQVQHLAGVMDSKIIVAINKDREAPIFDVADYGLAGDLFEILPKLIEKLGISEK